MFNTEIFKGKHLSQVEPFFREHNQPTSIIRFNNLTKHFGTNEGGPSYKIYIDHNEIVLKIEIIEIEY